MRALSIPDSSTVLIDVKGDAATLRRAVWGERIIRDATGRIVSSATFEVVRPRTKKGYTFQKFNPYHDEKGRFASRSSVGTAATGSEEKYVQEVRDVLGPLIEAESSRLAAARAAREFQGEKDLYEKLTDREIDGYVKITELRDRFFAEQGLSSAQTVRARDMLNEWFGAESKHPQLLKDLKRGGSPELAAIRAWTQTVLKAEGTGETIPLYRGVGGKLGKSLREAFDRGETVEVSSRGVTSWSSKEITARWFAQTRYHGMVLRSAVPTRDVLVHYRAFPDWLGTNQPKPARESVPQSVVQREYLATSAVNRWSRENVSR